MSYLPKRFKNPVRKSPEANQTTKNVPSPIGGLNARDPINAMPESDAYSLINWIPTPVGLQTRAGYMEWTTGLSAEVESVFHYFASNTTISSALNYNTYPTTLPGKVFAATKNNIYEITNKGAIGASALALSGGLLAGAFNTHNFSNAGGDWLIMNSETDGYFTYNNTTFYRVVAGAGPTQIAGVDPNNLVFNLPFKGRLWFVERNSTKLWYLPTGAIYGTAVALDVGAFLKHGGSISFIANWTIDAGTGVDDFLVIVGENGDVLIYQGTDPSSATTWKLQGQWSIGEIPKGRKAFVQYGGDLLLLSTGGLFPVSYITRGGASLLQATDKEYTSKIQRMISADLGAYFNVWGWSVDFCYRDDLIIVTVPDNSSSTNKQYVMNTITNQWAVFNGIPIRCSTLASGFYIFGTISAGVKLGNFGGTDNADGNAANGNPITGFILPAFTYFGTGAYKHFLMVRPTFISVNAPAVALQMNIDFNTNAPTQAAAYSPALSSKWDSALWDSGVWGGAPNLYANWYSVSGGGYAASLGITTTTNELTVLASIDYMFETGGAM
jgi:hypothetical protein